MYLINILAISKLNNAVITASFHNVQTVVTYVITRLGASARKVKRVHEKTETGRILQKEPQCRGQCFLMSSKTRLAGKRCLHS